MKTDEPVIIILDDEGSSPIPDPVGNIEGLFIFVLVFILVCIAASYLAVRSQKRKDKK